MCHCSTPGGHTRWYLPDTRCLQEGAEERGEGKLHQKTGTSHQRQTLHLTHDAPQTRDRSEALVGPWTCRTTPSHGCTDQANVLLFSISKQYQSLLPGSFCSSHHKHIQRRIGACKFLARSTDRFHIPEDRSAVNVTKPSPLSHIVPSE